MSFQTLHKPLGNKLNRTCKNNPPSQVDKFGSFVSCLIIALNYTRLVARYYYSPRYSDPVKSKLLEQNSITYQ